MSLEPMTTTTPIRQISLRRTPQSREAKAVFQENAMLEILGSRDLPLPTVVARERLLPSTKPI